MQLKFPQLISTNLLRLKRPTFDYGENPVFPILPDDIYQKEFDSNTEISQKLNINDIGQSGLGSMDILTVPTPSWRLYVGETVKILMILSSEKYDLQKLNLKVSVNTISSQNYQATLVHQLIDKLEAGKNKILLLTVPLENAEQYMIKIEAEYTSNYLFKELMRQTGNLSIQHPLVGGNYKIDSKTKEERHFFQVKLKNTATSSFFIEHLFVIPDPKIDSKDLNVSNGQSIFNNNVEFQPNSERTYLFELKMDFKNPQKIVIGSIEVKWRTYLGYPGTIMFPNIQSNFDQRQGLLTTIQYEKPLVVQNPTNLKIRLTNKSQYAYTNIKVGAFISKQKALQVLQIPKNQIKLIKPNSEQSVDFLVLPKIPGIHSLDMIWISDKSGKNILLSRQIGQVSIQLQ